jgi:hypothetical protein
MAIKPEEEPAAPAKATAARSSRRRSELDLTKRNVGPVWRQYLRAMGPGLVTGASDDDPSGIATYSQAGMRRPFRCSTQTHPGRAAATEGSAVETSPCGSSRRAWRCRGSPR